MRYLLLLSFIVFFFSCRTDQTIINETIVDNYIFDINSEKIYQSNLDKNKVKTSEQFISTIYSHYFQSTVQLNDLSDLSLLDYAIGDKQLSAEIISNSLLSSSNVIIVSDDEMRLDIESFINDTYLRFYQREPSSYEVFELKKLIESNIDLTPMLIYHAFTTSNEYKFY